MHGLILGAGFTGKSLVTEAPPSVKYFKQTRRKSSSEVIAFDLLSRDTWKHLPSDIDISFWTFPPEPLVEALTFFDFLQKRSKRIVVMGSTGVYTDFEVIENSEVDRSSNRVQAEETFLKKGAIVVRAAGLYGGERDPRKWVRDGRVGKSDRWVNFIHVEDMARLLWEAALQGKPGALYLGADGSPYQWSTLIDSFQKSDSSLQPKSSVESAHRSKRVNPVWTFQQLNFKPRYLNVLQGLGLTQ